MKHAAVTTLVTSVKDDAIASLTISMKKEQAAERKHLADWWTAMAAKLSVDMSKLAHDEFLSVLGEVKGAL
jgi:hypothetical protein